MSNNHKGKLAAVQASPAAIAAQLTITAFTDRPPVLQSTVDLASSIELLGTALIILAQAVKQESKPPSPTPADPVDKKRDYLGPRK